jgi:hypothetical protein
VRRAAIRRLDHPVKVSHAERGPVAPIHAAALRAAEACNKDPPTSPTRWSSRRFRRDDHRDR